MSGYFAVDDIGRSFVTTVIAVHREPKQFFEQMTTEDGSYLESIVLLTLLLMFPAIEQVYFNSLPDMIVLFPMIILTGIVFTWLWSEYIHRVLRLFLRIDVHKPSVFRVITYASAPSVLHVTVILSPVAFIWQTYLMWRGLVSHLGVKSEVAAWLVVIPPILTFCFGLAVIMFFALAGIDIVSPQFKSWGIDLKDL